MPRRQFAPITPGRMLREEFLQEYGLSQSQLAKATGIPLARISDIVNGRRSMNADVAERLSRYFGNSAEYWMNLQVHYDLKCASKAVPMNGEKRAESSTRWAG